MNRVRRTIEFPIAAMVFIVLISALCACTKKNGSGTQNQTPTGTVTPMLPEDDDTEPALLPEAQKVYQLQTPAQGELCAEIIVENYGSIYVRLFSEDARKAVENFKTLSENGSYDGIPVNRLVQDYMIQAGDKDGFGLSGKSIYGGGFANEISERLQPIRGALCMANLGEDSTNSIQFFFVQTKASVVRGLKDPLDNRYNITLAQYLKEAYGTDLTDAQLQLYETYGGAPWLYGHNTVFGQIYDGYEVLDAMMESKVTSKLRPNPAIIISTVRVFHYGEK